MVIASPWASHLETSPGSFQETHQAGHSAEGGPWAGLGIFGRSQAWDSPGAYLAIESYPAWASLVAQRLKIHLPMQDMQEIRVGLWVGKVIPGSGRSPGEGNGHPLQYSCLGNPMDREIWRATVPGVAESDATKQAPQIRQNSKI